ncbi:homeodomain-interacting protein kinase 4 [Sphaerodactylus townsendi]|uniref:homeodomain-interacting protein kinase 4 n=1 Tax=Sphaerodactylus townsendi TaxID=933632 RepID=UPI002027135C|nr:homeodomain-interacting protein kinase 4 [Sphaerodactylus townsendi]
MVTIQSASDCYDVFEILGKGTFGEVVKSWKRSSGEMVAIKILKNDSYRSRIIKNELKLLQTMTEVDAEESHIVQFHEFFHDELKFYLVFELLEQNLFDYQKEHNFSPLPVRHIRTVTTQVLRALSKLKELSIIHADLKPENIMLVDQVRYPFRVKVIDFGSASIFNEVRYVKEPYIQSRFYRAPEILLGLPFCEKVDVWSLGCVVAELHLGWPLYPGNNEYDQIRYICETQGVPRHTLLNAARKAHLFFKRGQHQDLVNTWQLKTPGEYLADTKVKSVERRKYVLKSLDQMETLNVHKMIYPDTEALAEYFDLRSMVELIKRMLTWDSHERITPGAALKHPHITTQPLKQNYSITQYYQACLRSLQDSLPNSSKAGGGEEEEEGMQVYGAVEEEHFYTTQESFPEENAHSVQRTTSQMDDLSLAEAGQDLPLTVWDEGGLYIVLSSSGRGLISSGPPGFHPAYYRNRQSSPKHRRASRHAQADLTFNNLILLGQSSPEDAADWEKGSSGSATSLPEPSVREGLRLSPTVQVTGTTRLIWLCKPGSWSISPRPGVQLVQPAGGPGGQPCALVGGPGAGNEDRGLRASSPGGRGQQPGRRVTRVPLSLWQQAPPEVLEPAAAPRPHIWQPHDDWLVQPGLERSALPPPQALLQGPRGRPALQPFLQHIASHH